MKKSSLASDILLILEEAPPRQSGGAAFGRVSALWRKHAEDLLMLVTQLRLATNIVAKTPGYEGSGRSRPGMVEIESGVKHLVSAIGDINKGIKLMNETKFLEGKGE
jgi:hypothetical protein